jgi:hypothetical protein
MSCLFFTLVLANSTFAQNTRKEKRAIKESQIKEWMDSGKFVFVAQMALPMKGNNRDLTSEYDVQVAKDTIISYLPYFGRAYSASLNPDDAGIKFISKDFTYNITSRQKGGWNISVNPKDVKIVQQLVFFVSPDGYASLQVTLTDRQPISFNGYVREKKEKPTSD